MTRGTTRPRLAPRNAKPSAASYRHLVPASLALLLAAGCPPAIPPPDGPRGLPPGAAVSQENLALFAAQLDAAVASTVVPFLERLAAGPGAPQRPATGGAAPNAYARIDATDVAGVIGVARIHGAVCAQRLPARYELSILFDGYSPDDVASFDGPLEFNFVVDETLDPPVLYGLYRGALTLGGTFGGSVAVHGMTADGLTSSLRVSGDGLDLLHGPEPPSFLAYVSTIAGTGDAGFTDGPGSAATFDAPSGIAVDRDGVIYVADTNNGAIREIGLDGMVSTIPILGEHQLKQPFDLGFDSMGKLVISDRLGGHGSDDAPLVRLTVRGDGRGTLTPIISGTDDYLDSGFPLCPIATHHSCDGRSPIASLPWASGIDVQGQSVLVAQSALGAGLKLALPDGYLLTVLDLAAVATTVCDESTPGAPADLAGGNNGEVYYTTGCHAVRVSEPDGTVRTVSGRLQTELDFADGIGGEARFSYPEGLVFDGERYLYVADHTNCAIRRIDVGTGETLRVAGCRAHTPGFACNSDCGLRDGPGDYALFEGPQNVALDRWGDLYVVEDRNHAVRLVRIIADPRREPSVHHFDPAVMQQGDSGTLTITGRNLASIDSVDLGEGVTVSVEEAGHQQATAAVIVAPDAPTGPRRMTVTTPFGSFTTPGDLQFTVMADSRGGTQVETIAGTGSATPDTLNYGLAQNTTFAFPGGMHAISADRLLVADPVEQRIRLIATRVGAVEEFFELLVYAASGTGVDVLGGLLGIFDGLQQILDTFGLGGGIIGQGADVLRDIAEATVDDICNTLGAGDCTWLSLPWAGLPYVPGTADGFRLSARFYFPTDIWASPAPFGVNSRFFIADAGNQTIRVVGYDLENQQAAPMQVFTTDAQPDYPFAVTPESTSAYASVPSSMLLSQLSLNSGAVNGDYAAIPRGVPLGIATYDGDSATDERSVFVADPLNATIWRVVNNGGVAEIKNIRGDVPAFVIGDCVDGPATFATWGAPMDVAVDQDGTVYVADCGCNSIRVIKDAGFGQDLDGLVGSLREFVASNQSRISAEAAQRIEENLRLADTEFLDANRFTVSTLAGSADGQPGYRDGPAGLARFNAPTSLAIASTGAGKVIFVADTGNRRIRRIVLP